MHAVPADQGLLELRPTPPSVRAKGGWWWARVQGRDGGGQDGDEEVTGKGHGALRLANRGTWPMYLFWSCARCTS